VGGERGGLAEACWLLKFLDLPGETDGLEERHAARTEAVTELDEVDVPGLPGSRDPGGAPATSAPRPRSPFP
jgi:hypothetical protein